jgi:cytidylate kinase
VLDPVKKQIITINGFLGSGKSTAMKGLAAQFHYDTFSSGEYFRELSAQRGLDLASGNRAAEKDASFDDLVDQRVKEIGESRDHIVIDSRMAWYWIPQSFKVYLKLSSLVAAQRIIAQKSQHRATTEIILTDAAEYAADLDERRASELRRYKQLYDVDPTDESHYDLVIDTTTTSPDEVIRRITDAYQQFLDG